MGAGPVLGVGLRVKDQKFMHAWHVHSDTVFLLVSLLLAVMHLLYTHKLTYTHTQKNIHTHT